MNPKTITVKSCKTCPYKRLTEYGVSYCLLTQRELSDIHLNEHNPIFLHECPLEYKGEYCKKYDRGVLVEDCEECISDRRCDFTCFKRGFIWGVKDGSAPVWERSYEDAYLLDDKLFLSEWDGPPEELILKPKAIKKQIPKSIRWEVWERDNFTCKECNCRKYLTIDHIIPESKGGKLEKDNLQTLCKTCNSKKGAK